MESKPASEANKSATDVDHYVEHLSAVSTQNEVTTTEDIYNERGVLLVKKGSRVDQNASTRLIKHRLTRPLEQQVQIRNTINRNTLFDSFQELFGKYPDLRQVHLSAKAEQDFDLFVHTWDMPPVLAQKLTVMQTQMNSEFEKGLFTAVLCYLIMRTLNADRGTTQAAFIAALVHDIGLLHIDPAVTQKRGTLTPEEWRSIQGHTVVGKVVLDAVPGLDPRVAHAVLEHHERCDGTGYPLGKTDAELERIGQAVGIADAIHAIRVNQFQKVGRNLRDTTAFLQMNSGVYLKDVFGAFVALLRASNLNSTNINPYGDLQSLVANVRPQWQALHKVAAYLDTLVAVTETVQLGGKNKKLLKLFVRLQTVLTQSGLLQAELGGWLDTVAKLPDDRTLAELAETDLMLNELAWQLRSVHMAMQQVLDDAAISALPQAAALRHMAEEMSQAIEKSKPRAERAAPTQPPSPNQSA